MNRKIKILSPYLSTITVDPLKKSDSSLFGRGGEINYADYFYNFDCSDGTLKAGEGVTAYINTIQQTAGNVLYLYFYKRYDLLSGLDDRLMFFSTDGYMYEVISGTANKITGLYFGNDRPIGVCYNYNGEDVIIFSSINYGMKIYDGTTVINVSDAPSIKSMCIYNERLFAVGYGEDNTLWFSDDFDPQNWSISLSEAGFIKFADKRGNLLRVLSFNEKLYVFRTYGISRITAYGDQRDFSVNNIFVSSGKIIENSITVCGDCILFMTGDGMFRFDGYTAVRISRSFEKQIDYSFGKIKGQYYNGKAYFIMKMKFGLEVYDNCILRIDPNSLDTYIIKSGSFIDLKTVEGENEYSLLVACEGERDIFKIDPVCTYLTYSVDSVWQSKLSDFGIMSNRKRLKEIKLYSDIGATVTVKSDSRARRYTIPGGDKMITLRTEMAGETFSIQLKSKGVNARIKKLVLVFEYYK